MSEKVIDINEFKNKKDDKFVLKVLSNIWSISLSLRTIYKIYE